VARARLIITAVVVEGRSKTEVARNYAVSRYWVQQLVQRYQREGPSAFLPWSRRPHHKVGPGGTRTRDPRIMRLFQAQVTRSSPERELLTNLLTGWEIVKSLRPLGGYLLLSGFCGLPRNGDRTGVDQDLRIQKSPEAEGCGGDDELVSSVRAHDARKR
jgi:hypothetical protein